VTLALRCLTLARAKFWITNTNQPTHPLPRPLGRVEKDNRYSGALAKILLYKLDFVLFIAGAAMLKQ